MCNIVQDSQGCYTDTLSKTKQNKTKSQYKCLRKHQYYIGNIIHYKLLFFIKTICFKHKRDMWPFCGASIHYQVTQIQSRDSSENEPHL